MPLIERYFLIHRIISLPMQYFVLGISYEISLFTYILEKLDKNTHKRKDWSNNNPYQYQDIRHETVMN